MRGIAVRRWMTEAGQVYSEQFQSPGPFERMHMTCTQLEGAHVVHGAGHSVVEEQPAAVNRLLIDFLVNNRRV